DPIEEAYAYETLADDFKLTHQEVAQIVSRDRATISNSIRLLKLPLEVQTMVSAGVLSHGHARAVLGVEPELQTLFAQHLVKYRLSVRQAEDKAKTFAPNQPQPAPANRYWHKGLEQELSGVLGLKAKVSGQAAKGRITLSYSSAEELARLRELLTLIRKDA
ncbi:MAG TPA: ParB/RepB/Spo0J family partition protein, partial [Candidatus Syntrophosphaera sp.]|nr:ParB/RepB/Spo0J family partition protein [Candidatus Syntrophosphaera sp.]